jgi:hypothetical protein
MAKQDVDAAAGEADEGGVVALLLGPLVVVVGPAGRIPETGESRHEQRRLQGVVAALGAVLALGEPDLRGLG